MRTWGLCSDVEAPLRSCFQCGMGIGGIPDASPSRKNSKLTEGSRTYLTSHQLLGIQRCLPRKYLRGLHDEISKLLFSQIHRLSLARRTYWPLVRSLAKAPLNFPACKFYWCYISPIFGRAYLTSFPSFSIISFFFHAMEAKARRMDTKALAGNLQMYPMYPWIRSSCF